jgi:DNA (cytosine-5)-methyltransferase 1
MMSKSNSEAKYNKKAVAYAPKVDVGRDIRVISFFTGGGGLDLGFEMAGYDVVYATDVDEKSCDTLKANSGRLRSSNTRIEQADVRKIDLTTLPKNIDLVIGGPPCQSFSASGRRAGGAPGRLDDRGTLFEAYCRIIEYVKPKAFLFENVRGILGTNKGEDWKAIVSSFRTIGYQLSYKVLDALDYGAPQQRERMILVGHKMSVEFLFPRPLYGPDSSKKTPHVTAGQALIGLADDRENKDDLTLRNGKYAHLLPLVPPGENYLHFTAKRGYQYPIFAYRSRFSDFLYKANPELPVKTLIASPGKYTGPFHWENRCFTVKEYLRLQGFPDGYIIEGERTDQIRQIGNSVSPRLSYQLALAIAKQIFNKNVDIELMQPGFVLTFDKRKGKKAATTKALHSRVALSNDNHNAIYTLKEYNSIVYPSDVPVGKSNVTGVTDGNVVNISVIADMTMKPFASMVIKIYSSEMNIKVGVANPLAVLKISAYGSGDHTVQTMWNAVDDWVIRSSNFHSLFELYGHFTEPHPIFEVVNFVTHSEAPIAEFAKHASCFANCSKYFPRKHLAKLFGKKFGAYDFVGLVKMLRSYRYDIRCHETNIAIPKDVYMVSYPFTLPFGKQMNFSVKPQRLARTDMYLNKTKEGVFSGK